jgi:hypothetical protein
MLDAAIVLQRIVTAEHYLDLVDHGVAGDWALRRADAEARQDIPMALALIHPNNWAEHSRRDAIQGPRAFRTAEIFGTRICSAADYWGIACRTDTMVEGAVADHAWPYGLGGPTTVANIAWMCRRHNASKGIDIHLYPWEFGWPDWLTDHLNRVERVLRRQLRT